MRGSESHKRLCKVKSDQLPLPINFRRHFASQIDARKMHLKWRVDGRKGLAIHDSPHHYSTGLVHGCQMAKFVPFLSLDCARVEGGGHNPRKGRDQILQRSVAEP